MKKKDIVALIISAIVIVFSVYFIIQLVSSTPKTTTNSVADSVTSVSGEFDENTIEKILSLSDYGKPSLSGIGKSDLFSSY